MHVAVVSICAGRADIERLRATIAHRIARVPRFRQVVARIPLDLGRPVWVDDETFDLAHHVRHIALPAPGDEARLQEFCDHIAAQALDPTRPLWELWLVELPKRRFAVIGKVHPLLADGIRSPEITDKLFTREPDEPLGTMPEWRPQPRPHGLRLAADGALDAALTLARRSVRMPSPGVIGVGDLRRIASRRPAVGPFDTDAAGRDRLVRWVPLSLGAVGRARDAGRATVSEVLLTGVTEGVADWLDRRGTPARDGALRVLLPLTTSLRAERGALGSRVSGVIPVVPVTDMSVRQRLASTSDAVQRAIGGRRPAPASEIAAIGSFAPPTLLAQAARLQSRSPAFDLSFTNAPGPPDRRYCIGAEVLEVRPVMPLAPGRALSVAAVSYNGGVSIGLTADPQRIPDVDALTEAIARGFADLAERQRLRRAA